MRFRLAARAMTLDDLERESKGYYGFFGDFGLRDTFQEQITLKSLEICQGNLHIKFAALNLDFISPSLSPLCSKKPAH